MKKNCFSFTITVIFFILNFLDVFSQEIPDNQYVTVKDGHLSLNGERVRYWGYIGNLYYPKYNGKKLSEITDPSEKKKAFEFAKRSIDAQTDRMVDLGYNLVRYWVGDHQAYTSNYQPGDGSMSDFVAYSMHIMEQKGIKIWWAAGFNKLGSITPDAVNIINETATAEKWKAAIQELMDKGRDKKSKSNFKLGLQKHIPAVVWDKRLRELVKVRMIENMQFQNKYKNGLKIADDPQVVVWELTNEEWWFHRMVSGKWESLPKFFKDELFALWHEYLIEKYQNEDNLKKAWSFLVSGESLEEKTIMLAPMKDASEPVLMNDTNPKALDALKGAKHEYSMDDFTRQRGSDVVEFLMGLWLDYKSDLASVVKQQGKSAKLSPLVWDTGIGYEIQSQYLHQQADAVTMCTYLRGMHHDKRHERYPFNSGLEELPTLSFGVPWVENAKSPNKPFFVYENQIENITKYRSEYPMRIVSAGMINDWDIINWHYFGSMGNPDSEKPFDKPLEVGYSLNLHYGHDEVQMSQMRTAAEVFKNSLIKPIEEPTVFVFGKQFLYDPKGMVYGESYGKIGELMTPTSFANGCNIFIDTTLANNPNHPIFEGKKELHDYFVKNGFLIKGRVNMPRMYEANPIKPTDEIEYDYHRGHLKFDAPGVAAYTGFLAKHKTKDIYFRNGVILSEVEIINPENMPYPVTEEEQYISFMLASKDGKSLKETENAVISLVSTSFNTGYELEDEVKFRSWRGYSLFDAKVKNRGTLPVQIARVGGKIKSEALNGMTYILRDWHMNKIGEGKITNGEIFIKSTEKVFFVELNRKVK